MSRHDALALSEAADSASRSLGLTRALFGLVVLATVAALLSILCQGYGFGVGNDAFYVPYVLRLPELPQFVDDPFYATLKNFTTLVWPALRLVANDGNVEAVFLAAHVVSRTLGMLAILFCIGRLGVRRSGLIAAATLLAVSPLFQGESLVGKHGLFVDYFTHSELTTPCVIAALMLASRGYPAAAFALAGVTFDINAFVGLWLGATLALAWFATHYRAYRVDLKAAARDGVRMTLCFAIAAMPTALWIASTLTEATSVDFNYIAYLRDYYPFHFIIDAATPGSMLQLACMIAVTLLALTREGFERFWLFVYRALLALFLAGAILPYMTTSRLLLNLHLLRVDGVLQLLSTVVVLAATLRDLPARARLSEVSAAQLSVLVALATGDWYLITASLLVLLTPARRKMHGILFVACVVLALATMHAALAELFDETPIQFLTAAALVLVAGHGARPIERRELLYAIGLLLVAVLAVYANVPRPRVSMTLDFALGVAALAVVVLRRSGRIAQANRLPLLLVVLACVEVPALRAFAYRFDLPATKVDEARRWRDVVAWIRDHPEPGEYIGPAVAGPHSLEPDLQSIARVPVWVDWKRGGAVMWSPAYYAVWSRRYDALNKARTSQDLYRLACREGVRNVVVEGDVETPPAAATVTYRNPRFQVVRLALPCQSGAFADSALPEEAKPTSARLP